jgi:hypothetical protein
MWLELGSALAQSFERFELAMFGYVDISPVDRARNMLMARAMLASADWLLMVDADTWVESATSAADAGLSLLRMISDADRAGATVVGAPVVCRTTALDDKPKLSVWHGVVQTTQTANPDGLLAVRYQAATSVFGVGECDAIGAACMAINLHKVGDAHFAFTPDLSEDLEFCRQVRAMGGKIIVDGRVRTGHLARQHGLFSTDV